MKLHPLKKLIAERVANGLKRKAITSCSKWAETYRVMGEPFPGNWSFEHHPWLLEMHDAEDSLLIGQKAAQMGYTEWAMNTTFYSMDVLGYDVLYILPSSDDASDFSSGRFDPALESSPHLQSFFSDVNNVGLKRAGTSILYVRGSRSRSKLKSIPTPVIVYDEVDEMDQRNIALSEERQSGQRSDSVKILRLSTPTLEDFGINANYKLSSQEHFMFKCPRCSRYTELTFPECLVITAETLTDKSISESHYVCKECKGVLPNEEKVDFLRHKQRGGTAHFIPTKTDYFGRGFHVNQMYSMAVGGQPAKMAIAYLKSLTDPTYEQEFFNSKLAKCHAVEGSKITDKMLSDVTGDYRKGIPADYKVRTLGIDVGSVLHMVVLEWTVEDARLAGISLNDASSCRLVYEGKSTGGIDDFDEAYAIFKNYQCASCVVDSEPEYRSSLRFAQQVWGRIFLCDYLFSQRGKEATVDEANLMIKVNRTAWMDTSLGRFRNRSIKIPVDTSLEFKAHVKEPVRQYKEDKWGNKYGVYLNVNADHFAHALTYAEIALPLGLAISTSQDIQGMY